MTTLPAHILRSLTALTLLIACATESGELPSAPGSPMVLASDEPPRFSDWSAPVNLGPNVNSASTDIEVSVSRDGLSMYIASNRPGGFGGFDIWISRRARSDEPWGPAENLGATINTPAREQAPFLSLDGHRLYFFSDRPGGFGGTDLYVSRRRSQRDELGWQGAENLGAGVNGSANETLPVYFDDEYTGVATLYFTSNREASTAGDIYASTLQPDETFGPADLVAEISSSRRDRVLAIRRDGLELFLASDRPGPVPTPFDLWVSTRGTTSQRWSTPAKLEGGVNSASDEGGAALSFDGTTLYFNSDRPGGLGSIDVWASTRSRLTGPE